MNSVRVGWGFCWNAYATALAREFDGLLSREESRRPAAGPVDAVWTLPAGGEAGCLVQLKLSAEGGAERNESISVGNLGNGRAAASLARRLWDEFLSAEHLRSAEDGRAERDASLQRWADDGGPCRAPGGEPQPEVN